MITEGMSQREVIQYLERAVRTQGHDGVVLFENASLMRRFRFWFYSYAERYGKSCSTGSPRGFQDFDSARILRWTMKRQEDMSHVHIGSAMGIVGARPELIPPGKYTVHHTADGTIMFIPEED